MLLVHLSCPGAKRTIQQVLQCSPVLKVDIDLLPVGTAQGGGGSFKDRKPIGTVRCCESRMAEQIH